MKFSIFIKLCDILRLHIQHQTTNWKKLVEVEKVIAIVLHKLAFRFNAIMLCNIFCISPSIVFKYTKLITKCLFSKDILYTQFVSRPIGIRLESIIQCFLDLSCIPNPYGVIDESHIRLAYKPPLIYITTDYWNRHDNHNIVLQAICDYNFIF